MTRVLAAVALAIMAGTAVAAAAQEFAALQIIPYEPPKPAPAFALSDLDGKTVRLEDVRGKVALLFFWATW